MIEFSEIYFLTILLGFAGKNSFQQYFHIITENSSVEHYILVYV